MATVENSTYGIPSVLMLATRPKMTEKITICTSGLRIAHEKGVKIAYGTDAGVNDHGTNAYEAVLMNEAGMPAREILIAATVNAADLMSLTDITGTIESGKDADIIAVGDNPLEDLSTLLNPTFVMARGNEIDLDVPRPDLFPWPSP